MSKTKDRLRDACSSVRRKPTPLSVLIPLMQEAADQIDALEAENVGLRKDAERYRWLRHGDNDELVIKRGPVADDYVYLLRREKLDEAIDYSIAAIDAALKETP